MRIYLTLFLLLCLLNETVAQLDEMDDTSISVRSEHQQFYGKFGDVTEIEADSVQFDVLDYLKTPFAPKHARKVGCRLTKNVYGYHPSWLGPSYYNNYDYSLLSTFCYFSYELDSRTGNYKTIHSWKTSNSINLAQQAGARVELCVTNFGGSNNARFLNNRRAWERLANNLIELLAYRNADGVNIDFEHVRRSNKEQLTAFMIYLSKRLKKARPGSTVTMALPALNSYNIYDVSRLEPHVDLFIIMGYDYHYSRSKHAGAVSPLNGYLSIRTTINNYINTGVKSSKLILAVPYYGREWRTKSSAVPSNTRAYVKAPTYSQIRSSSYKTYKQKWHNRSASPYLVRASKGQIKQCWYDSSESLGKKYDLAISRNLGGIGIWALGYDNGRNELWDLLEDKFMSCSDGGQQEVSKDAPAIYNKSLSDILEVIFKASNYQQQGTK